MNIQIILLRLLVNIILIISIVYIIVSYKLYRLKGYKFNNFALFLAACAIYSLGYFFELNSTDLETMIIIRNIEFIGVVLVPTFGILFVNDLTKIKTKNNTRGILLVISLILWLNYITNPFHNLVYKSIDIFVGIYSVPITVKGPLFFLIILYYAAFLIYTSITINKAYRNETRKDKKRNYAYLQKVFLIPWFIIFFIIMGWDKYIDPVPGAILVICGLFLLNEKRNNMFDIEKEQWKMSFYDMNQPIFLADIYGEIIIANKHSDNIIQEIVKDKDNLFLQFNQADQDNKPILLIFDEQEKWYSIKRNEYNRNRGYYNYIFSDVTRGIKTEQALRESEDKYRLLSDVTMEGILIHQNGIVKSANNALINMLGSTREEIFNQNILEFLHEEDRAIILENIRKEYAEPYEVRVFRKNGEMFIAELEARNIKIKGETFRVGAVRDITERKKTSDALVESKNFLETLLESIPVPVFYKDNEGKYLGFNKAYEDFFGKTKEMMIGKDVYDLHPTELAEIYLAKDKVLLDNIGTQVYESKVLDSKGIKHEVVFNKATITNIKGEITGLIGAFLDITDRKLSEIALKESEEKYRLLVTQMKQGLAFYEVILDNRNRPFNLRYLDVNQSFINMTGLNREDLIGKTVLDIFPGTDREWIKNCGEVALKGTPIVLENYAKDVEKYYEDIAYSPKFKQLAIITNDITKRKRLEEEIVQEKKLLEITLISVGDGVISTDDKGNIVFLNRIAESLTGYTQNQAKGKPITKVFNIINEKTGKKSPNIVDKVLNSGEIHELSNHTVLISKDGTRRSIEDSAAPIKEYNGKIKGVVLVFRDFTEKKQKQDKIEFLSYHDQLTGLYNRRFYEEELIKIDNNANLPLTLIMGDVNGLKLVNDSFGHKFGDELLIKTADIITKCCRPSDIIARLGGDEFVILLPKTSSAEAEKIISNIKSMSSSEKVGSVDVSISFGHETKHNEYENIQDIFITAEDRMYRHKLSESTSMRSKTIDLIMNTLYEKSYREMIHSRRVGELSQIIANLMNFDKDNVNQVRLAGLMHDIGKVEIDKEILNKDQKLSKEECIEVKRHPEIGYRILSSVKEFSEISDYVLAHHERWDGKGYPKGLKGEEIPLEARIVAIADAYDAMTSDRTYKKGVSVKDAIERMKKCSGTQFDPVIIRIFVDHILSKEEESK